MIRCPHCDSTDCQYSGGYHELLVYLCESCDNTFSIKTDELPEDEDE